MMDALIDQIFSLLTTSPGSLAYHLVLAFSIVGAFQIAFGEWQRGADRQVRRWVIGLGLLLILQLAQFILAALGWLEVIPAVAVLPPVDRGVSLLSLLVIAWLWTFPRPSRLGDGGFALVGLILMAFVAISIPAWGQQESDLSFNQTWLDFGVQLAGILVAGGAIIVIAVRRRPGWGYGFGMMGLLMTGHLLQAWLLPEGDYAGVVRIFQIAAYPILLLMPRYSLEISTELEPEPSKAQMTSRYQTLELALIRDFIHHSNERDYIQFCKEIARSISKTMLADFCLLITSPDSSNQMHVTCGYNLIQETYVDSFALDGNLSPMITNSMKRGRPVRLTSANDSPEAYGLSRGLGISRLGHLLHVPVSTRGNPAMMGIILITPHSNRAWTTDDQLGLVGAAEILANLLNRRQASDQDGGDGTRAQELLTESQQAANRARREVGELQTRVEQLNQQLVETRNRAESLASLVASQEAKGLTEQDAPMSGEGATKNFGAGDMVPISEYRHLETELNATLHEMAAMKNLLAVADQEVMELKVLRSSRTVADSPSESPANSEQAEVIASLAQELRQPMSSIVGYTDLLLGESVGLLGATQRKFLERVKASIERMGGLVDDLIQTTTMQSREMELSPEMVDLNTIIDDAVANSIARLREKNILLRMDLPDRLPLVHADRDALQQILLHLLQNAGAATPVEGEILLRAQVELKEDQPGFVLVQVADSGGGIPPSEMPRVFSRLYRADNALIQGVGDTGVGLSIVKALVEAHGGRVWVDSTMDVGSTFSVLLPLSNGHSAEHDGGVL